MGFRRMTWMVAQPKQISKGEPVIVNPRQPIELFSYSAKATNGEHLGKLSCSSFPTRKFSARAALVDLHETSRSLLSECFRQFGIDSVAMTGERAERLASEKFEACVVRVGSKAAPVLESARRSRSNSRMVIYGLGARSRKRSTFRNSASTQFSTNLWSARRQ